jgi:hypothetical protein
MLGAFAALLVLIGAAQSPSADRSHAEQLARAGHTEDALRLFTKIADDDPADIDARLWVARLALRLGRTAEAEARFRAVIRERPDDVDARIGLGTALTRRGEWEAALAVLRETEPDAGANGDFFAAMARAYRRAGDDRLALDYFRRARALAPDDPDLTDGYEAVARVYGHSLAFEGFGEGGIEDAETSSGSFVLEVRALPTLRLHGTARVQQRAGVSDMIAGGGVSWRFTNATTASVRAIGGVANVSLPTRDLSGEITRYAGVFEIGGSIRQLSFAGAEVLAASPMLAHDAGRWRTDGRYTYSRSRFDGSGEARGDHSVMVRETWRGWRRVSLTATYAYGIESFETLTADRIGSLGMTTAAGGVHIRMPSLTSLTAAWEHQWRSNETSLDRLTVGIVQSWP